MAHSGAGSAANADRGSADQTDAAARKPDLITGMTRRRAASGLSQAGVARLMGTSQPAVARLESGRHDAQLSTLSRYAEALGGSVRFVEDRGTQAAGSGAAPEGEAPEAPQQAQTSLEQPETSDLRGPDQALTPRQRRVLQVIKEYAQRRGYPPSMREIGQAVGLASASSVAYQLSVLQSKGYLRRDGGRARTVEVWPPGRPADRPPGQPADRLPEQPAVRPEGETGEDTITGIRSPEPAYVPVVDDRAAAGLVLAEEGIKDVFALPRQVVGEGKLFLLQAADRSMIGAGIGPGDWVVVRRQPDAGEGDIADEGDIVAVMFDGKATVRVFRRSGGQVWLTADNATFVPISGGEARILGRVVAHLRQLRAEGD
jgi:repressor LexA